jgi:hypothetical protein
MNTETRPVASRRRQFSGNAELDKLVDRIDEFHKQEAFFDAEQPRTVRPTTGDIGPALRRGRPPQPDLPYYNQPAPSFRQLWRAFRPALAGGSLVSPFFAGLAMILTNYWNAIRTDRAQAEYGGRAAGFADGLAWMAARLYNNRAAFLAKPRRPNADMGPPPYVVRRFPRMPISRVQREGYRQGLIAAGLFIDQHKQLGTVEPQAEPQGPWYSTLLLLELVRRYGAGSETFRGRREWIGTGILDDYFGDLSSLPRRQPRATAHRG